MCLTALMNSHITVTLNLVFYIMIYNYFNSYLLLTVYPVPLASEVSSHMNFSGSVWLLVNRSIWTLPDVSILFVSK